MRGWSLPVLITLGVALGGLIGSLAGETPGEDAPGLAAPEMTYYLANQAFFSGETEDAQAGLRALEAAGVAPASLCPGQAFTFKGKGQTLVLCDPDSLRPPPAFEAWAIEEEARAQARLAGGDLPGARGQLERVLVQDPYRPTARALMIATLRGLADAGALDREVAEGEIARHGAAIVAQSAGRLLAIEAGGPRAI